MDNKQIRPNYYVYEEDSNIIFNCFDFDYFENNYSTSILKISKKAVDELLNQYYQDKNKYEFIFGIISYSLETTDTETSTIESFESKYKTDFEIDSFNPENIEAFLNRNNK